MEKEQENPLVTRINTIGNGAYFPITLTKSLDSAGEEVNTWAITKGEQKLVKQNLSSILVHQIGERFRQENFGSRLWEFLEEPNTTMLQYLIRRYVIDSISAWEPRIKALSVSTTRSGTKVVINVKYQIELDTPVEELNFEYNPNNI